MLKLIKTYKVKKKDKVASPTSVSIVDRGDNIYLVQGVEIVIDEATGDSHTRAMYRDSHYSYLFPFSKRAETLAFTNDSVVELKDSNGETIVTYYGAITIRILYTQRGEVNIVIIP